MGHAGRDVVTRIIRQALRHPTFHVHGVNISLTIFVEVEDYASIIREPARASRKRFQDVSCTGLEPSLLHTQISAYPERLEAKTILEPSDEY